MNCKLAGELVAFYQAPRRVKIAGDRKQRAQNTLSHGSKMACKVACSVKVGPTPIPGKGNLALRSVPTHGSDILPCSYGDGTSESTRWN